MYRDTGDKGLIGRGERNRRRAHTHVELAKDDEGEREECLVTQCRRPGGLLREWRETLFSLEADRDQVGSVVSSEFEGASAVDGCTRSFGGIETPGALEVTRCPGVNIPVCVVPRCVFTSVAKCVLQRTHSAGERRCVRGPRV